MVTLRHSVTILDTSFTTPTNLINELFILKLLTQRKTLPNWVLNSGPFVIFFTKHLLCLNHILCKSSICSIDSLRLRCHLLPMQHPQQYSPPHISPRHFLGKAGLAKPKSVVPSYAIKHSRYSRHTAALLASIFKQFCAFCRYVSM